jgi:hypothetical protein
MVVVLVSVSVEHFSNAKLTLTIRGISVYWEPGWIGNANLGSGCSVSMNLSVFRITILSNAIG